MHLGASPGATEPHARWVRGKLFGGLSAPFPFYILGKDGAEAACRRKDVEILLP